MTGKVAIYSGTFDPFTKGHEDLVRRAARLFERVIVAVADSKSKRPLFGPEERVGMVREILHDCPNIEVRSFSCLLMDFLHQEGAQVIVRGLRAVSDFEYEFQLAGMNKHLVPEADTIFMPTREMYSYISSSLIREIASLGGDVSEFVHPIVRDALAERFAGRQKK